MFRGLVGAGTLGSARGLERGRPGVGGRDQSEPASWAHTMNLAEDLEWGSGRLGW